MPQHYNIPNLHDVVARYYHTVLFDISCYIVVSTFLIFPPKIVIIYYNSKVIQHVIILCCIMSLYSAEDELSI